MKRIVLGLFFIVGIYSAWVLAWSRQGAELASVRLGVDRCHHCGMIVSEMRYAISVLGKDEQGHPVTWHFDDPGCYEAFARAHPGKWTGVAHDARTGSEIPLDRARFVHTGDETPMGSGTVVLQNEP